jgi:hypothetical protein
MGCGHPLVSQKQKTCTGENIMSKPFAYNRIDRATAAVLLVDHQTGLLSLVRDIDPDKFKNIVTFPK